MPGQGPPVAGTPLQPPPKPAAPVANAKVHEVAKDGLTLEGAVAPTDMLLQMTTVRGQAYQMHAKLFLVKLSAGKKYRVTMDSTEIDSFLYVVDEEGKQGKSDDDSGGNNNALLIFEPAKDGKYGIFTAAFPNEERKSAGKFILKIREIVTVKIHNVGKDGLILEDEVLPTDPKLVTIKEGKGGRQLPAKAIQVRLSAGKKYRIAMDSKVVDSYLSVRDQSGHQLAWDDDSGDDLNALVLLDVFKDGVYTIHAASFKGGGGKFSLKVTEDGAVQVHEVGAGLKLAGSLDKVDTITYCVRLLAGKTYVIDMVSPDPKKLDPLLRLLDINGKQLAEDDDGGGGVNARIRYKAWDTGIYRVVAGDFDNGEGPFTLTVRADALDQSWRDADTWTVNDQELLQADKQAGHWLLIGDPTWTDYDFEVEAQVIAASEVDIAFRVTGPGNLLYVALGGAGNTRHGLLSLQDGKPGWIKQVDGQTRPDLWYRVRVEARGNDCKVFLDGKPLLTYFGAGKSAAAVSAWGPPITPVPAFAIPRSPPPTARSSSTAGRQTSSRRNRNPRTKGRPRQRRNVPAARLVGSCRTCAGRPTARNSSSPAARAAAWRCGP